MNTVTVVNNQTLMDIAIQESGSALAVFDWAVKNNKSITAELEPGEVLYRPDTSFKNIEVAGYFKGRDQMIATGLTNNDFAIVVPDEGIGAMIIEQTFEVQ